jgi:hypothetical protein
VEELIRGNRKFNFNRETIEPLILHVIESRPEPLRVRACPNPYKMDLPPSFPLLRKLAPHPLAAARRGVEAGGAPKPP